MKLSVNLSYVMVVNWTNLRAVALLAWLPRPLFQGQYYFQTCCKKDDKNQKFLRKFFACFNVKLEASIRCRRHFSICNIKGVEKNSYYLPVHLFQVSLSGPKKNVENFTEFCHFMIIWSTILVWIRKISWSHSILKVLYLIHTNKVDLKPADRMIFV